MYILRWSPISCPGQGTQDTCRNARSSLPVVESRSENERNKQLEAKGIGNDEEQNSKEIVIHKKVATVRSSIYGAGRGNSGKKRLSRTEKVCSHILSCSSGTAVGA